MAKSGYSMKTAYKEAGHKMGVEGSPAEERSESKAEAKAEGDTGFMSSKKGEHKNMVKCPECGAHFEAKY
jgi:hypothetical protein